MITVTCQINVQKSELELERLIPQSRASAIYLIRALRGQRDRDGGDRP
jgi:hypothetical protein